jgi:uncharacterized protein Usg
LLETRERPIRSTRNLIIFEARVFPALQDFPAFWQEKLDGPLYSVTIAHSRLIKPAELRAIDGIFRLH